MNIHATDTNAVSTGFAPALSSDRATPYALNAVSNMRGLRKVGCQAQLFSALADHERQRRVRIWARERMPFAPTIHNDGFLYCWEPT